MGDQNAEQDATGLVEKIIRAFAGGLESFFSTIWNIVTHSFNPDNPPPEPEISTLRRCCATIAGTVASLLLIFLFLGVIQEQRRETVARAVDDYVGVGSMVLAFIALLNAIYWGIAHNDRAEYKLLVSSAIVTMFFPVVLLTVLFLLVTLVDMIL